MKWTLALEGLCIKNDRIRTHELEPVENTTKDNVGQRITRDLSSVQTF